jgi:hypothetical protein
LLIFFQGGWIGFFLSLARYDWATLRRVHGATIGGFAWFVLAWLISTWR